MHEAILAFAYLQKPLPEGQRARIDAEQTFYLLHARPNPLRRLCRILLAQTCKKQPEAIAALPPLLQMPACRP